MNDASADWQLHIFGGVGRSFTSKAIDGFNIPGTDHRSWTLMRARLEEALRNIGSNGHLCVV